MLGLSNNKQHNFRTWHLLSRGNLRLIKLSKKSTHKSTHKRRSTDGKPIQTQYVKEKGKFMEKIKFDYSETGEIPVSYNGTIIDRLLSLVAVGSTAKTIIANGTYYHQYATDEKGLNELVGVAGESLDFLHESIRAVSALLVYAEKDEIKEDINSIAWLLASLSDLASYVSQQEEGLQSSILHNARCKKASTTNN